MSRFSRAGSLGLKHLADNSYKAIDEGVYDRAKYDLTHNAMDIRKAIYSCPHAPLITEVKFASPSAGQIYKDAARPQDIGKSMVSSGAVALSVLTQPHLFNGSPDNLAAIRRAVDVPLLMKDIVVSEVQIDSAKQCGADCVLLIMAVFDQDLAEGSLDRFIDYSRRKGLQVLLEVHKNAEFLDVSRYKVELVGINNRNLDTMKIDIAITENLLKEYGKGKNTIVSESGIKTPDDIRYLRQAGADAFLIGTGIMESADIAAKVQELYHSI